MMDYTFPPIATQAIVTGGASGIGREVCFALASRGVSVAICDTDILNAHAVAAEVGVGAKAYAVDVADPDSLDAQLDTVLDDFPETGILINSAGIVVDKSLADTGSSTFRVMPWCRSGDHAAAAAVL